MSSEESPSDGSRSTVLAGQPKGSLTIEAPPSPDEGSGTRTLTELKGAEDVDVLGRTLRRFRNSEISGKGQARFRLGNRLGQGSQGVVFVVHDRDCGREVALKTLKWRHAEREEIARFIHEAQITAQLEHPGIVPVHDFGVLPDGTVFYTMKRIEGTPLHDWLAGRAGLPAHRFEAIGVFLRICEAMAFAHSRSVVHRDLKPRNIMVGTYGEVLVLDWGLAKLLDADPASLPGGATGSSSTRLLLEPVDDLQTSAGTAVGTPAYMSPEQALGRSHLVDRRSDVYALGVILYEILAGMSPYERGNIRRTMSQVADGSWTPLERRPVGGRLPRRLVAIVHRAMALEQEDRYQSVEELAADLKRFVAGEAVAAYRESPLEGLVRHSVRHRRVIQTALLVAAASAAIGGGLWLVALRQEANQVAALRREIAAREIAGDQPAAAAACERLLALRPADAATLAARDRLADAIRKAEEARSAAHAAASRHQEAARLRATARERVAAGTEADIAAAGDLLLRALGLTPHDPAIGAEYQAATQRRAELAATTRHQEEQAQRHHSASEQRRRAAELEAAGDLHGAVGAIESSLVFEPGDEAAQHLSALIKKLQLREQEAAEAAKSAGDRAALAARQLEADQQLSAATAAAGEGLVEAATACLERARGILPSHPGLEAAQAVVELARSRQLEGQIARLLSSGRDALSLAAGARVRQAAARSTATGLGERLESGDAAVRQQLAHAELEVAAAGRDRAEALGRALGWMHRALEVAPEHPEVRRHLADFFKARLVEAEEDGDLAAAAAAEAQARAFAGDGDAALLAGLGIIANTGPEAIALQRILRSNDRTEKAQGPSYDLPPGARRELLHGRWLAVSAGGVTRALRLNRGDLVEVALPFGVVPPPGAVVVPGGDLYASDGRIRARMPTLVAMAKEVTCAEWLGFLNDPEILRRHDQALARGELILAPREQFDDEQPAWMRDDTLLGKGGFRLVERIGGRAVPGLVPVGGISWDDAVAYAEWRARRDRLAWRLPSADEWVYLAQGGDGRSHPWGDASDPGLCASAAVARADASFRLRPGGQVATDVTPQGILDLAGSRSEFVTSAGGQIPEASMRLIMGGNLNDREPARFACWSRREVDRRLVDVAWGLRLVYTP